MFSLNLLTESEALCSSEGAKEGEECYLASVY